MLSLCSVVVLFKWFNTFFVINYYLLCFKILCWSFFLKYISKLGVGRGEKTGTKMTGILIQFRNLGWGKIPDFQHKESECVIELCTKYRISTVAVSLHV